MSVTTRLRALLGRTSAGAAEPSDREFLRAAYRGLLDREPDAVGAGHYLSALKKGHNRTSVLMALATSGEFRQRILGQGAGDTVADQPAAAVTGATPPSVDHVGRSRYDAAFDRLAAEHPADRYLPEHRERYGELFDALARHTGGRPRPRVLELGPSAFSILYRELFADVRLVTVDRPVTTGGMSVDFCVRQCGAERHYEADLCAERLGPGFGTPPLGQFDFVACAEVLEHLLVEPVAFLADLLSLVAPGGVLYLTTPNFLSHAKLRVMEHGENPLPVFPGRGENGDGHHHYREYCMKELLRFVELAGGLVVSHSYSPCWDDEVTRATVLAASPERASCLVIVARPEGSD